MRTFLNFKAFSIIPIFFGMFSKWRLLDLQTIFKNFFQAASLPELTFASNIVSFELLQRHARLMMIAPKESTAIKPVMLDQCASTTICWAAAVT